MPRHYIDLGQRTKFGPQLPTRGPVFQPSVPLPDFGPAPRRPTVPPRPLPLPSLPAPKRSVPYGPPYNGEASPPMPNGPVVFPYDPRIPGIPGGPGYPTGGNGGAIPQPGSGTDLGLCKYLPSGAIKDACNIVWPYLPGLPDPNGNNGVEPCPPGSGRIPGTQTCVAVGDLFPGGDPGVFGAGGEAVRGSFGIPGIVPSVVGNIASRDGTTGPILRCPSGMALARDNICYVTSLIPRKFRKWNPGMKPLLTGGDRKILSRAKTLRGTVKRIATASGFTCKKK